MPVPITAIVDARPAAFSAPRCAAPSIPSASPLTTLTPEDANASANSSAVCSPPGDALRLPTIASAGSFSRAGSPLQNSIGGGSVSSRSAFG